MAKFDLAALVVEVKFLFARDGHTVFGCWREEPLPYLGNHRLIDGRFQTLEQSELRDFAVLVDHRVENDVAFGAVGERGQIGMGVGEVLEQRDADVSLTETTLRGASCPRLSPGRLGGRRSIRGFLAFVLFMATADL